MIEAMEAAMTSMAAIGFVCLSVAMLTPLLSDLIAELINQPKMDGWWARSKAWGWAFTALMVCGLACMVISISLGFSIGWMEGFGDCACSCSEASGNA